MGPSRLKGALSMMIPQTQDDLKTGFVVEYLPSQTFKMRRNMETISGLIDDLKSVEQAVFLILNTERYEWLIHSWNYGVELQSLVGKDVEFCIPEIERRVREALLQDDRITSVQDFEFEVNRPDVKIGSITADELSEYVPIQMY